MMNQRLCPQSYSHYNKKPLGNYLVEAGLLTHAQIAVALQDQKSTGLRFGEVLVARGWLKEQTIEYLMSKIVLPEQQALSRKRPQRVHVSESGLDGDRVHASSAPAKKQAASSWRRELPITKPLPPVSTVDEEITWVG